MKIAISGKGGSGKTTVAAFLAREFAGEGLKVYLIDADPDGNLAISLGLTREQSSAITPIINLKDLIAERTGSTGGGYFKMNPDVSDIPEKYSVEKDGIRLMALGTPKRGGTGCYCPENAFIRSLLRHLLLRKDDVVILDMPAGIEHLGRGTAETVDCLLVLVEPTAKSVQTALRTAGLSRDLGIKRVLAAGNKVTGPADEKFIVESLGDIPVIGAISLNDGIPKAERNGLPVYAAGGPTAREIRLIKEKLQKTLPASVV
jgi:CO dehydrogenase maturation factor